MANIDLLMRSPISAQAPAQILSSHQTKASGPETTLSLSEYSTGALYQIAGWSDFAEATAPVLSSLGFDGLGDYRTVRNAGLASCFRIGPDKLLLRHQDKSLLHATLEKLDPARSPTLDLSHSRWIIEIEGIAVEALLARLAAIDFSLAECPDNTFIQTGIHHVAVMIHRISADKFAIYVPVTWARSLWDFMIETASPFGYSVKTVNA